MESEQVSGSKFGITAVVTLIFGVFPQVVGHVTEVTLASAGG